MEVRRVGYFAENAGCGSKIEEDRVRRGGTTTSSVLFLPLSNLLVLGRINFVGITLDKVGRARI